MENEKTKIQPATIIQHVVSALLAVATAVFAILGIFGLGGDETAQMVYKLIAGLGAVATTLSELIPFVIKTIKDKNFKEILSIVRQCVTEVENIQGLTGAEKKARVLEAVQKLLAERHITFDVTTIDAMIESIVEIMNTIKKG